MRDRVTVRMTNEMIAGIDAWITMQRGYVSRQEAVRRLVAFSLERIDQLADIADGRKGTVQTNSVAGPEDGAKRPSA